MTIIRDSRVRTLPLVALVLCYSLASRNGILTMLSIFGLIGIVCSREERVEGAVASSAKVMAVSEDVTESYVPQVEQPRAELVELPVETVEGIGPKYGKKLRDAGIKNLADLLSSMADEVANVCNVSLEEAQIWIAVSRFCWLLSVSQEDAEAIVYGGGIIDLKELASANPQSLLGRINDAVQLGHVTIPEGYEFKIKRVKAWISEAQDLLSD